MKLQDSYINILREDTVLRDELISCLENETLKLPLGCTLSHSEICKELDSFAFFHRVDIELAAVSVSTAAVSLQFARPSLLIQDGKIQVDRLSTSSRWIDSIKSSRDKLESSVASVGRVEFTNHQYKKWGGTAWLIMEDVVITNRHVAKVFSEHRNGSIIFRTTENGRALGACIDFREEYEQAAEEEFKVEKVLYLAESDEDDIALLRVSSRSQIQQSLPEPLSLANNVPPSETQVAAIGYSSRDTLGASPEDLERIFFNIFNVKRFAPGLIKDSQEGELSHDCSVLKGNSGSALIDMQTGEAVGLHCRGLFRQPNFAISCTTIAEYLRRL